jgi:hypothetical protein
MRTTASTIAAAMIKRRNQSRRKLLEGLLSPQSTAYPRIRIDGHPIQGIRHGLLIIRHRPQLLRRERKGRKLPKDPYGLHGEDLSSSLKLVQDVVFRHDGFENYGYITRHIAHNPPEGGACQETEPPMLAECTHFTHVQLP